MRPPWAQSPMAAIVERDTAVDLHGFKTVSLLLRNPDFTTAKQIADAVNAEFSQTDCFGTRQHARRRQRADAGAASVPLLISRVQNLSLNVHTPARIVINERTGTIVLGGDVKLTPVSVIHGNLSIQVVTTYGVAPIPGVAGVRSHRFRRKSRRRGGAGSRLERCRSQRGRESRGRIARQARVKAGGTSAGVLSSEPDRLGSCSSAEPERERRSGADHAPG